VKEKNVTFIIVSGRGLNLDLNNFQVF